MHQMSLSEIETVKQSLVYTLCLSQWNGTTKDLLTSTEFQYFTTPDIDMFDPDGELIDVGVIDNWQNEVDGLKDDQDALNEFYRQFPRTTEHAFRDETKNSIFNLVKIYRANRL